MKKLFIFGAISLAIAACSSNDTNVADNPQKDNQEESVANVEPNRLLTMEVDGMVCQMGCGGAIRKELKKTGAVSNCEFDFEEERKTDVVKIAFDKEKISVDQLVNIVGKINDGQFRVGKVSSEELYHHVTTEGDDEGGSDEADIEVTSSGMGMPSLLDVLSGLI